VSPAFSDTNRCPVVEPMARQAQGNRVNATIPASAALRSPAWPGAPDLRKQIHHKDTKTRRSGGTSARRVRGNGLYRASRAAPSAECLSPAVVAVPVTSCLCVFVVNLLAVFPGHRLLPRFTRLPWGRAPVSSTARHRACQPVRDRHRLSAIRPGGAGTVPHSVRGPARSQGPVLP
jgi:hypothetical protein